MKECEPEFEERALEGKEGELEAKERAPDFVYERSPLDDMEELRCFRREK